LKGHGFSRAAKAFIFCHHERALAREGSAFPTFSAACWCFQETPSRLEQIGIDFCLALPEGKAACLAEL
jgi:hypothetical protein